jgi:hypothetical protein
VLNVEESELRKKCHVPKTYYWKILKNVILCWNSLGIDPCYSMLQFVSIVCITNNVTKYFRISSRYILKVMKFDWKLFWIYWKAVEMKEESWRKWPSQIHVLFHIYFCFHSVRRRWRLAGYIIEPCDLGWLSWCWKLWYIV